MDKSQQEVKIIECGHKRYAILQNNKIGQGAYSVVKVAVDLDTHQKYAVKIIKLVSSESKSIAIKELEIAQSLKHCINIVKIEKVKVESVNNVYIFMELCSGGTLFECMQKNKGYFPEEDIYRIFAHMVNGYRVFYEAKVLHEDIKPENVLVHEGVFKLADFGLAISAENTKCSSKRRGTLYYMSLEKLTKKDYISNYKSDIYSLGVMMYEIITRRHPYVENRGLNLKEYVKQLKDAKLQFEKCQQYSLKFNSLFQIIIRMVNKSEQKRITWEELYSFFSRFDSLQKYIITQEQHAADRMSPKLKFMQISKSQATYVSLCNLSYLEKQPQPSIETNQVVKNIQPKLEQNPYIEVININRQIVRVLSRIAQLMDEYLLDQQDKSLQILQLILYTYRSKVMVQIIADYEQDGQTNAPMEQLQYSQYLKQQSLYLLSISILQESEKRKIINFFKDNKNLNDIEKYIHDSIKTVLTESSLSVIKINYQVDLLLFLYLIGFQKLIRIKSIKMDDVNSLFGLQKMSNQQLKSKIESLTPEYCIMFDPQEKELTEEFEMLPCFEEDQEAEQILI